MRWKSMREGKGGRGEEGEEREEEGQGQGEGQGRRGEGRSAAALWVGVVTLRWPASAMPLRPLPQ